MKDFRTLKVWTKAHTLALDIYKITRSFPKQETYGLCSQIRQAASSVPTNIAEGCGRGSDKDFSKFLYISMGSACEVEYLLILARDLKYLDNKLANQLITQIQEIKKMIST
jgi:four helix bundle protein